MAGISGIGAAGATAAIGGTQGGANAQAGTGTQNSPQSFEALLNQHHGGHRHVAATGHTQRSTATQNSASASANLSAALDIEA